MAYEIASKAQPQEGEAALQRRVATGDVFIGPSYDVVTDEAVPLLNRRAQDVGEIYSINPTRYPEEYMRFRHDVAVAAGAGALRLADRYQEMTFDEQVAAYTAKNVKDAIILGRTVEVQDALYEEAIDSVDVLTDTLADKEAELQEEKVKRNEDRAASLRRLIQLRLLIVNQLHPNQAQLEAIDALILEQGNDSDEKKEPATITDKFKLIVSQLGHKAFAGFKHLGSTDSVYDRALADHPSAPLPTIR